VLESEEKGASPNTSEHPCPHWVENGRFGYRPGVLFALLLKLFLFHFRLGESGAKPPTKLFSKCHNLHSLKFNNRRCKHPFGQVCLLKFRLFDYSFFENTVGKIFRIDCWIKKTQSVLSH